MIRISYWIQFWRSRDKLIVSYCSNYQDDNNSSRCQLPCRSWVGVRHLKPLHWRRLQCSLDYWSSFGIEGRLCRHQLKQSGRWRSVCSSDALRVQVMLWCLCYPLTDTHDVSQSLRHDVLESMVIFIVSNAIAATAPDGQLPALASCCTQ